LKCLPLSTIQFQKLEEAEHFHRDELDVLRFGAFLSVFLFHAAFFTKVQFPFRAELAGMGAYGMCLFFLLSAYLITELLTREREKTGTVHIRAFFARRVLRIWPLYFGFIAFTYLLGSFYPRFRIDPHRIAALTFLTGNWYVVTHGPDQSPAGPLWSISLEEQFYLIWPFLAKWRDGRGLGVVAVLLLPMAWLVLGSHHGVDGELNPHIWSNSFVQFQFFALGALTSLVLRHTSPHWSRSVRGAILLLGLGAWFIASWTSRLSYPRGLPARVLIFCYILMAIGCLCFLLALLGIPSDLLLDGPHALAR
jgi:peptidoglycan/LPS O-acetylase OafA/YrhL